MEKNIKDIPMVKTFVNPAVTAKRESEITLEQAVRVAKEGGLNCVNCPDKIRCEYNRNNGDAAECHSVLTKCMNVIFRDYVDLHRREQFYRKAAEATVL